jgi:hypothetical protein
MMATHSDSVGMAVALRETFVLFLILFGVLSLRDLVDPKHSFLMAMIASGAVTIKMGSRLA